MKKHTKEIKQFIAILLASVMVAAYVVPSYADDSILQDNVKEQTENIENSEENVPTPGAALAPTEQPVVTQQPTESQEQEETIQESTPEATAQPEETDVPVEEPVATETPGENPVPEVTPEVDEQPQSTEQPGEIVVPTATPESAPTIAPAVTEQPVVIPSASPEGTPTCAPSETPAGLEESSPSVSPEITPSVSPECTPSISPTPSGTPSVSATPSASPEAYVEPEITFVCQDEEGMILGTEQVPEFEDSLSLESVENAPIAIEGYTYINAELDGTVIAKLTKTIKEIEKTTEAIEDEEVLEETVAENSVETIVLWSYVTEDGETIQIEEDTEITLNYEEDEVVVSVNAACVDSFGDEISAEYTQIELPEFTMDYLLLDDADIPPVENVQVRTGLFKVTKYTYVQATIDKEIIKALKRTVAKDTQDSTEKEYIYSYTTDGTTWNKIKKDTTVYFVYSDGKKTTYTYEDSNVSVVATLQHAGAIPDDAQFIVTPITPESNGYNYDAYMEALNENADVINPEGAQTKGAADKYTEENTLLYDIAFLAPAVDENGDVMEGEMVEYQPAEGMVNISFTFKKSQISEGLDVTEAKEVSVVHLPLVDSVREQNATTEQATDITAKDIKIEVVEGAISLEGSEDKADFNLSDFSVMAVTADGEGNANPTSDEKLADENYTLEYLLRSYNIVALGNLQVEQHTVGSVMVMGNMTGASTNNMGQDAKAPSYIGGTKTSNFVLNGSSAYPLYVGTGNTITYPYENMTHTNVNGILTSEQKNVYENPSYVDSEKLETAITGTATGMQQQSTAVYNVSGTESGSPYQILAGSNVTLKLNGQQAYLSLEGININNTEPTVINILDTGTVYLPQITGLSLSGDSGANMSIVFNIPNASKVILQGDGSPKIGHVVAPQADIDAIGGNYNGCLIGNNIYTTAEGHMYPYTEGNGSLVKPTFNELGASKTVDGNVPTEEQVFSFGLDILENSAWENVQTVTNSRGEILFSTINYNAAGTYWYRVYEVQNGLEDYTLSTTQYVLKAVVTEENGSFTVQNTYYKVTDSDSELIEASALISGAEVGTGKLDSALSGRSEVSFDNTSQGGAEPTPSAGAPETVDLSVTKKWVDEDDLYGKRPYNITITVLKNNGVYVTNATFRNEEDPTSDTWEYTFTGLPKYDDKGAEIEYTIQELNVDGYTSSIEGDVENGFTVTNTYVPETVSVKVTKAWSDNNNFYQTRPDSVSVQLKANGANYGEVVTLTQASNNWSYTWTDLPKYDNNGSAINYTVEEVNCPSNYSSSLSGDATNGYVITNTLKTIDISGSKTWTDKNNAYGIRPNSIVVRVKSDDESVSAQQTVTESGGWSYSFTGLPKYNSQGNELIYTVSEDPVPGYVTTVNGYNITNTIEVISIPVTKAWNDDDDALGNRPDSVTVKLMKNGNEQVGDSQTLNADNNWTHTFTELQKYDAQGNQISYTVVEENIAMGYSAVVTGDATNGYVITNNYTPGYVSRTVNKVWVDGEDKYHTRPESIKVQLYANGDKYGDEVTLNSAIGWTHTWTDLPETKNGEAVAYTVQEVSVPTGYEAGVTQLDNTFTITNTLKTTNVSGSKTWIDGNNTQNRPAKITIYVKNGDTVVDSKDVTASDNWSWSFEGLPAVDANGDITYTIEEAAVNGYTTKVEGYNVTNTINQETLSINGEKTWVDPEGTEHPTITINLLQDNKEIREVTLENGTTTYEFTNLPKYDLTDGHEYAYTVTEDAVTGYTTTQSGNDFTNTINQTKISVSGTKTWIDPEGTAHPDITIHLLQDGNEFKEVTLKDGTTTYNFADLDKYAADGHEYAYTVTEDAVEGYTTEQTGNNFKNTIKQESIDISGTKTWVDPVGTVHPTVTIELWRDGAFYKETTIANGESTYSFNGLNKYDLTDGHEYQYTVQEVTVDGYVTTRDGNNFTNTISQDSVSVSGDKTWIAPAGTVHPAITINLLQNGVEIHEKTLPNGVTSYSFENLDKYAPDGSEYVYTVTEDPVEGYTTQQSGNNFTNTINQVKFDINGTKKWVDPAGTTHETITIYLLQDGSRINSVQLKDGETSYSFKNLDKYADNGHVYEYTVEEDVVSGYTTKIEGYQITNTINQEQITVSGVKTWVDPEGTEHPTIKVNLYRDSTLLQTRSLADGNVNYSFENLDKYAPDGHVYSYTVSEENIEGYTASYEGYNITNTINQKYTSVNGNKTWVAPEGTVYPEITIHLLQDGEEYRETKLASGVTNYEFTNLPVYDLTDGHIYEYTVEEEALADYTGVQNGFDFTNIIKQQTFDISGTKTWLDEDGNAQPEDTVHPTVTIQLLRDGSVIDTKELPSGTTEYSFENLPKYDVNTGHEYIYTVQEVPVDGYLSTQNGYDFINKASADKVNISGIKTWVAPVGTEYPEITIYLLRDDVKVNSVTLPSGTTTYSFTELDKYAPDSHLYVYTVEEEPVEGYTTEQVGFNFKNTIEQTYIDVSGSKTWVDPEGTIHPTITINLLKDGTKVESLQLQNGETEYSFTCLEKYDLTTGREYAYTIKEDAIPGYTTTYNGNDIINTIAQETMSVTGTKKWIAPEGTVYPEITVNLLQNGTKIASKTLPNGTVEYSFDGLSKYDANGHAYVYTIEEEPVTGYTGEVSGYNLVNTIEQETVSVSGTKTWVDPEGTVHPTITICLMRDTQLFKKVELEDGEIQYSFTDLDKYDLTDGHVYEYTVEEETVDGYTTTYNGTEIINTIEQEKTSISGNKTWVAPEGTVYPEITINLLRDGVEVDEITLTNGTTSYSFIDLDMYDLTVTKDGHKYVYTVTEDALPGYTSQQNGTDFVNTYIQPSASPTAEPTAEPTEAPTAGPTEAPTAEPSATPTATAEPSVAPTTDPTATATPTATVKPTSKPTAKPTSKPTSKPTATPAKTATPAPTATATAAPTAAPTATIVPTPSSTPVVQPTDAPVIVERPQRTPTTGGGSEPTIEVLEPNTEPRILAPVRVEEPSVKGAVRGARRGLEAAVLGRRRRPVTGDSLALLLWIMTFSVALGTAVTSGIMMSYEKEVKKKQRIR